MTFVDPRAKGTLTVGDEELCGLALGRSRRHDGPILHACKYPCYAAARRVWSASGVIDEDWWKPGGALYLSFGDTSDLYLNMIDPPTPLFQLPMFQTALDWLDTRMAEGQDVLIHCNQGASRAPSLALLWLVRRWWTGVGSPTAFSSARLMMNVHYDRGMGQSNYAPGAGLSMFLEEHWAELTALSPV